MNKRAGTENSFWLKFLVIGLGTLAFGAYSGWDAVVSGPHQLEVAKEWEPINLDETLSEEAKMDKWRAIATKKEWSLKRPKKKYNVKSRTEFIYFNYGMMALSGLIALPCLIWCLKTRGTWIESTENGLRNSAGQELTLDQITKVDKARWDKKGITVVHYNSDQAGQKTFLIDDLKYKRSTTDEIMAWVEQNIDPELIVNGRTEAQIATDKAQEAAEKAAREQLDAE